VGPTTVPWKAITDLRKCAGVLSGLCLPLSYLYSGSGVDMRNLKLTRFRYNYELFSATYAFSPWYQETISSCFDYDCPLMKLHNLIESVEELDVGYFTYV
jgi:hypothetical protein